MSQSSLETQLREAGIPIKRGVKVAHRDDKPKDYRQTASNIWLYRWAANSYRNYPMIRGAQGVKVLADTATGIPAILVGVGPSLDECWPALEYAVGRAVIIATDAAFRPLIAHNIQPDLMLSYDCKPEQKLLWADIEPHSVVGLFDSCAHPDTIESWKGPLLFYNHFHQADELSHYILPHVLPNIGQIPSGATVGNTAVLLAKILGCSPVLLAGMDLCYGKNEAGWLYRARDYRKDGDQWVPGELKQIYDNDERVGRSFKTTIKGVDYRMDPELAFYHDTLLALISHFQIETVNCAPNGALKDAMTTLPLDQALERFCPTARAASPLDAVLQRVRNLPDPRHNGTEGPAHD